MLALLDHQLSGRVSRDSEHIHVSFLLEKVCRVEVVDVLFHVASRVIVLQ